MLSSLQDIAVPALVTPTAPADEQKAPGWTTAPEPELDSGLGAGLGAGFGAGFGAGAATVTGGLVVAFVGAGEGTGGRTTGA
ncbi:hypothetical protein GCM10009610_55200 [Pseudonocardia xinjiangensis]